MSSPAFGVTFDDAALAEDLAHTSAPDGSSRSTPAASSPPMGSRSPCCALAAMRAATEHVCPGCVKTYLPAPVGDWGMVFEGRLNDDGRPFMHCLAFGRRHPLRAASPASTSSLPGGSRDRKAGSRSRNGGW